MEKPVKRETEKRRNRKTGSEREIERQFLLIVLKQFCNCVFKSGGCGEAPPQYINWGFGGC